MSPDDPEEPWLGPFESGESFESSHSWDEPGTNTITVTVTDFYDGVNFSTHEIYILGPPELNITSIEGGTGITVVIKNIGETEATEIKETISNKVFHFYC